MNASDLRIGSVATSVPPFVLSQSDGLDDLLSLYGGELSARSIKLLQRMFNHPAIATRHFALDPDVGIAALKNEDPDARMARFTSWAIRLSQEAAAKAMAKCGLAPHEIDVLIVNTCTGYICPGISTYLLEPLGLRPDAELFDLSGSGCAGAVPNLRMAASLLAPGRTAVCVSVEICSAAFQMGDDPSLLVSNSIFGDGASAAVVWDRPQGPAIRGFASLHDPSLRDHVRFVYKNGALHNQISERLPAIVAGMVPDFLKSFIGSHGYAASDIAAWALHSGGDRMINAIEEKLGIAPARLTAVRNVQRDFGNMSSPTALFSLERLLGTDFPPQSAIVLCAYGAGMSVHACMLTTPL